MFIFPKDCYVDVRIEKIFKTVIKINMDQLDECKETEYSAAFIRLFDGNMWYYSSTTDINAIQKEINSLYKVCTPTPKCLNHPIVKKFEVHNKSFNEFPSDSSIKKTTLTEKKELLKKYNTLLKNMETVKNWASFYVDTREEKEFFSSKGSHTGYNSESIGVRLQYDMVHDEKKFQDRYDANFDSFKKLQNKEDDIQDNLNKSREFLLHSKPIKSGSYRVVLSPLAAGIFAHESFGHKSESDFMVGDETMKKEWTLGKKVGSSILTIVDSGICSGKGYVPFDDEGTQAKKNYLIKNGVLSGRLHSVSTAVALGEEPTGNARAMNFEYEPIVRMTSTYIEKGSQSFAELISDIQEGIYIETVKHGSGMSTFTLAPLRSYMIRNGKIEDPVQISVVTGNVFETLNLIEGLSNTLEIPSFTLGGCGKMEQHPLRVSFGGPHVRIKKLMAQ